MKNYRESIKYFTALFQIRNKFLRYIKSLYEYKKNQKVEFPKTEVFLHGAKFLARENTMDIAHLSSFYEHETTKLLLKMNPKYFVDVGAHVGRFSIILGKKGSKVLSIEASKETFNQLKRNASLNDLDNKIEMMNIGCSDKNGKGELYLGNLNEGTNSLVENNNSRKEEIKTMKLDKILEKVDLKPQLINVIKIDVEGFEINVLKGSKELLQKGSPILIIEILNKKEEDEIKRFLKTYGFSNKKILDFRNFVFSKK